MFIAMTPLVGCRKIVPFRRAITRGRWDTGWLGGSM